MYRLKRLLCVICLMLFGFTLPSFGQQIKHKQDTLTIGRVTDQVRKESHRFEPIAQYLTIQLKSAGIQKVATLFLEHNNHAIQALKNGTLDVVLETPFSVYHYQKMKLVVPILLVGKDGVTEYNTYIFTHKSRSVNKLDDLKGKIIAFEDPGSTSAYFLPKTYLDAQGYHLVQMENPDKSVPKDKIGFVFAKSELNISRWVYSGKVAAGVLSSVDWIDNQQNPEAYREQFQIIARTETVPRMVVAVRNGLDGKTVTALKHVLLNMNKTPEGRAALKNYKIDGFHPLPEDTFIKIKRMLEKNSTNSQ